MLYWAAVFFIIAIVAGFLGFGGIAVASIQISQVLFFIFLVLFLATWLAAIFRGRGPPG